jgi:hypothetical protein
MGAELPICLTRSRADYQASRYGKTSLATPAFVTLPDQDHQSAAEYPSVRPRR